MACFVAPATAAVITTVIKKKVPPAYHIEWLLLMLLGGVLMLIVDHVANHEIVPHFPFFTKNWSAIWPEILRVGIPMTIAIFIAWLSMVYATMLMEKKKLNIAVSSSHS